MNIVIDPTRCKEEVREAGSQWPIYHQCARKRTHGEYCKQHDPEAVKAKREAREAKWKQEFEDDRNRSALHSAAPGLLAALKDALEYIPTTQQGPALAAIDEAEGRAAK